LIRRGGAVSLPPFGVEGKKGDEMGEQEMARLADHAMQNPEFLEQFRQDPVGAARGAGFEVSEHEATVLQGKDYSGLSDTEVVQHISQAFMVQ
jgi:hypothetical protein